MKGMIVFSFALREREPNPCNIRLARAAERIIFKEEFKEEDIVVVAQRTVSLALHERLVSIDHVVQKKPGYGGSEEVVRQAAEVFRRYGITEVIPVAQPFLLLTKCVQLVRKAGFRVPSFPKLCRMIGWIGFDWYSRQPWTRDPIRLVYYTMRQIVFGYRPPPELSE